MIFRSENYIEGGGTWFFRNFFLSPIRTKLLSVIVLGQLNSGIVKVPAIEPIFLLWGPKIWIFWFFAIFSKIKKIHVNFFRLRRSALTRAIQRCKIHCHMLLNKGAMGV
jgi:hypothetical protein